MDSISNRLIVGVMLVLYLDSKDKPGGTMHVVAIHIGFDLAFPFSEFLFIKIS